MIRRLPLGGIALAVAVLTCFVAISPANATGLNFAWSSCRSDGGTTNKTFACASNTGSNTLVCSYVAPDSINFLSGNEIVVDLISTTSHSGRNSRDRLPDRVRCASRKMLRRALLPEGVSAEGRETFTRTRAEPAEFRVCT